MTIQLTDDDLPSFWEDGEVAAATGQKWTLWYTRGRLVGAVTAALGGAIGVTTDAVDVAVHWMIAVGFLIALVSEVAGWVNQTEVLWYEGRALAESAKTLAWRYAVGAHPFPIRMADADADAILHRRLADIAEASPTVTIASERPLVTPAMAALRHAPFDQRKQAYLSGRTNDQRRWYVGKAKLNQRAASRWRLAMVIAEIVALFLAAVGIAERWSIDLAGIVAALIAAAAAWFSVKQYASLAAAYSTAARELTLQLHRLSTVRESEWAEVAANAEGAISREHTMWLASRTGRQLTE